MITLDDTGYGIYIHVDTIRPSYWHAIIDPPTSIRLSGQIRYWTTGRWSTVTQDANQSTILIPYKNIPESLIEAWTLMPIGSIVAIDRLRHDKELNYFGSPVAKITNALHLHSYSLYKARALCKAGDRYYWYPQEEYITYASIADRKLELTDSQYTKILEADLDV